MESNTNNNSTMQNNIPNGQPFSEEAIMNTNANINILPPPFTENDSFVEPPAVKNPEGELPQYEMNMLDQNDLDLNQELKKWDDQQQDFEEEAEHEEIEGEFEQI